MKKRTRSQIQRLYRDAADVGRDSVCISLGRISEIMDDREVAVMLAAAVLYIRELEDTIDSLQADLTGAWRDYDTATSHEDIPF